MAAETLDALQFLVENAGILMTILFLIILFPMVMTILMWRMVSNLQKNTDNKLDNISDTLKEMTGLVNGLLSIVHVLVLPQKNIDDNSPFFKQNEKKGDS